MNIKKLLIQSLSIFFIIMSIDYLMNLHPFMKKIPLKLYFIISIVFYIILQSLLKIQENFENDVEEVNMNEMEEESPMMDEPVMEESPMMDEPIEEKPKTNAELSSEIPNQMEERVTIEAKEQQQEQIQEAENVLVEKEKEPKEDLKKIQDKYIIMPVESWIKNDINLMKEKQLSESCSCPTVLDGSFASY